MLDDSNFIAQRDPQDILSAMSSSPTQLTHTFDISSADMPNANDIDIVAISGMGGSALAAETLKVWPGIPKPLIVSRNYSLPEFINKRSLVIISSFSGNTEETLSALDDAKTKGAHIVIVANGGKLKDRAAEEHIPFVQLPNCIQPRIAAGYSLNAFVSILEAAGIVHGAVAELNAIGKKHQDLAKAWAADVPTSENPAKRIAEEIAGTTPIMYAGILFGSAYKWKIGFNENAKNLAWCNQLPEFNHNEFIGWSSHPIEKPFTIVNLLSTFDHPRVQKRFVISEKLLSGKRPESIDIQAKGDSILEQMIWIELLGSMVSAYVAILNGVNPTPVDLVENFKKELG